MPLPANFLAAMTPTPNSPAVRQPALQQPESKGSPITPKSAKTLQGPQLSASSEHTVNRQPFGAKVSNTPVPIPRLPGLVQKSASRPQQNAPLHSPAVLQGHSTEFPPQIGGPVLTPEAARRQASSASQGNGHPTANQECASHTAILAKNAPSGTQEFSDVPGKESMEFMDRLLTNIRTIAHRDETA